jgi:cytochrome c-type biogenesis protein CcmE
VSRPSSSVKQRRWLAAGALLVAGGVLAFVAWGGMEQNLVYYWNAEELLQKGEAARGATVRLGGVVKQGTVKFDNQSLKLAFDVGVAPEPGGVAVHVDATGSPPQMFREGIGVVVEGIYDGALFRAERVLVKHSNEYRPPAAGEHPKDLYGTLVQDSK